MSDTRPDPAPVTLTIKVTLSRTDPNLPQVDPQAIAQALYYDTLEGASAHPYAAPGDDDPVEYVVEAAAWVDGGHELDLSGDPA